jgi:hypothetical protein
MLGRFWWKVIAVSCALVRYYWHDPVVQSKMLRLGLDDWFG